MSDSIPPKDGGESQDGFGGGDDILAAEYVLHLLSDADRQEAEARLAVDGGFRARVVAWTEDMVLLADDVAPVDPPASVRAALVGDAQAQPRAMSSAAPSKRKGLSFGALLGGVLGGGLVAAAAVVLLTVVLPNVDAPGDNGVSGAQTYAADVATPDGALLVSVRYDATENVLVIARGPGAVPEGRDLEAWLLTEDQPPHSVGVIPEGDEIRIDVAPFWGQRIPAGSFAVSEEPLGGSPTGLPTGEILAVADVSET